MMSKKEEYLKFYIDSNANIDAINKYIRNEKITLNEFNDIVNKYIQELENKKQVNKLYLEYCLKFKKKTREKIKVSRKETLTFINIINNYINEDKHNIKEYISNTGLTYQELKKFINNYKYYYLTDKEKEILKKFLKRENDFNNDNKEKIKSIVDKISDDLVNIKQFDIYDYYTELGWDSDLLINYLNNNKDIFSQFVIDNVKLYIKKYGINCKKYKKNEFIELIKNTNKDIDIDNINIIVNFMSENNLPYIYTLFLSIKNKVLSE